jgi:peptide/nickel transport system substrate-binding protein
LQKERRKRQMSKVKIGMSSLLTALLLVSIFAMGCPRPVQPPPPPPPPPPVRMGAWLDEIVGTKVTIPKAYPMLAAEELDIFVGTILCPEVYAKIVADPDMDYEKLYGVFRELTLNPAGTPENPTFHDGRLNPFAVPRIREAMNWLVDREHIAEEIAKGMAIPRFFPIHPAFPDYARYIDIARRLELYYAHKPEKAREIIFEEMEKLGAKRIDGIWHWPIEGVLKPVEIIVLGRIEDERKYISHYVTGLMEDLGFKVKELVKTAAHAAPLWLHPCPYEGKMHIYTGGWIATVIDRDQKGVFDYFYTERGLPFPLWKETKPTPEFDELALRLDMGDFACLAERAEMFGRALELALEDSHRVWLTNNIGVNPRRADMAVAADLAGGIGGAFLWGLTVRYEYEPGVPKIGGTAIVGQPDILVDPWNPLAGSAWFWDVLFSHRAMTDYALLPDPFTGLWLPQRLEKAAVYVKEGLPVGITHDWLTLDFVPEIRVPADAWVDWCAVEQQFITLAEAAAKEAWDPARETANVKVRVYYPADLFETVRWHDGSPISVADFVISMIMGFHPLTPPGVPGFDRAKPESPIFDQAAVPPFKAFMEHFRGVRIISEDPLIIESFTNMIVLDAEVMVEDWTWFPATNHWPTLAIGKLAEMAEELAFGKAKAGKLKIEWMSLIAGPSLPILEKHLAYAIETGFIPYAPTLAQFLPAAEVAARYAALMNWFKEMGHFFVSTGPFYLHAAHPIEEIVHMKRFPYFPDPAEKWVGFVKPKIAEVDVVGPAAVSAGDEAVFNIEVTFLGEPYLVADVDFVSYLMIDAVGEIVRVGKAVAVQDGLWQVVLPGEFTAGLIVGSTRLEIAVSPLVVAVPTFGAASFLLLP